MLLTILAANAQDVKLLRRTAIVTLALPDIRLLVLTDIPVLAPKPVLAAQLPVLVTNVTPLPRRSQNLNRLDRHGNMSEKLLREPRFAIRMMGNTGRFAKLSTIVSAAMVMRSIFVN